MKTESTLIMVISVILLPFLIFSGCGRRGADTNNGFFWEPVDPEVDSLVAQFDEHMSLYRDLPETSGIVNRLDSFANQSDNPAIKARAYYAKAIFHRATGNRSLSNEYLDSAKLFTDSVNRPYECARILEETVMNGQNIAKHFAMLQHNREVFKSVGDSYYIAESTNRLAVYNNMIGNYERCMSLHKIALKWFPSRYIIERFMMSYNIALTYEKMRDSINAKAIIDTLRLNDMRKYSPHLNIGIMVMSYTYHGEVDDLNEAYHAALEKRASPWGQPYIASLLTRHYIKTGEMDSARHYGRIVRSKMEKPMLHYEKMLLASAKLYEADDMTDSAKVMHRRYEEEIRRLEDIKDAAELTMRDTREQIEALEAQLSETDDHKQTVMWVLVVVILVASGIVAFILLKRHHNDHDRHRMKKRLEQHDRRLSVAEIKIADKKRQMDEIAECLTSIKGPVPPEVSRLLAQMKTNSVDEVDWETISLLFAELNPEFKRRLHEKHPDLTASYVRLASLIYLGLGTKHIARLLAINPDSVKKSRQRLRAKLGLTPDIATETYLWELANGKI